MSARDSTLTQARLKELLHYDPETGVFTRLQTTGRRVDRIGKTAGFIATSKNNQRYTRVSVYVCGAQRRAHRLAWLYMTGKWPSREIDHIDGNATNNAFTNLRETDRTTNCENLRRPPSHNTSGFLGAYWDKRSKTWRAKIVVGPKQICLGTFSTPEEAGAAYVVAKRKLHPGCTI